MRWPGWPSLPLLSKELIEQSNRRRTFVLRTAYAVLLYVSLMWTLVAESGWNSNSLAMLGRGRELFDMLVGFQFFAIYAFLPGLAAGVLAAEKERDTLAMLLLTKLGGWTIVVEKLLSRLMPLAMLMLLSLPLLAVAYSLGGVSLLKIVDAVWVLGISAMQVGALTVFCSAWYRTAAGAFVATYILGFSIICFPLLLYAMLALLVLLLGGHVTGNGLDELMELTLNFFGPYVLYEGIEYGSRFGTPIVVNGLGDWILHLMYLGFRTSPLWITGFAFLAGARLALWPRAFVRPQHRIMKFLRAVDGVFHELNQNSITNGVVLLPDSARLPEFHPISWRETTKKPLGTTRYLVRFLVVILPFLLIVLLLSDTRSAHSADLTPGTIPNAVLWTILSLIVTVLSTGLIAGERSRQTLDVLLSTPLTSREILRQKLAGVRKASRVMSIPLLVVLVYDVWVRHPQVASWPANRVELLQSGWMLVQGLAPIIVYPAIILWVGFHLGLRMRNQGQAMLATMALIFAWCVIPAVLEEILGSSVYYNHSRLADPVPLGYQTFNPLIYVLSPFREELLNRALNVYSGQGWKSAAPEVRLDASVRTFAIHFGSLLVVWLILRWWGYAGFGRFLRRNEGCPDPVEKDAN